MTSRLARPRTWRLLHQAVARRPPAQPAVIQGLSADHLHAIYQDLMTLDPTPQTVDHTLEEPVDGVLVDHAKRGNTHEFELAISRLSDPPTEHQRDLHIKTHIVSSSLSSPSQTRRFPTSALAVLHQYEASGHVAPIKSYTRVISALFNVQTCPSSDPRLGRTAARAQAWDLFAHMRYVAHPVPDAHLYALMIRACGSFSRPEPERALDLWTEMQENGLEPTKGAYEAIIRVCGKAGPEWLGEATRLAREMSNRYSITGTNGRGLWCALLEGCKRSGDLNKARWILAEAVRGSDDNQDLMVDTELMTHMFHTYASYKIPFRRETTRVVDHGAASNDHVSVENVETVPSFSRLPPQTSSDVIAETRALFDRILQDRSPSTGEARNLSQGGLLAGRFARVELTPVLLNAYLSVFYRHASIETSKEVFDSLFSTSSAHAFPPDEHGYINALERCAIAPVEERRIAARWAKDIWERWEAIEAEGVRHGKGDIGSFARLIERAHVAMRRVLTLSGDIDGALASLRSFVSRYPPKAVLSDMLTPTANPPILSTRTVLTNPVSSEPLTARPLIRLTSAVSPKDDRVPPIITFGDVDLLHARLVEHGRIKDVGYIKWICMAYASALKKRRAAVLQA